MTLHQLLNNLRTIAETETASADDIRTALFILVEQIDTEIDAECPDEEDVAALLGYQEHVTFAEYGAR